MKSLRLLSLILLLTCMVISRNIFSQITSSPVDSLTQILHKAENDTTRVIALNALVKHFIQLGTPDSSLKYCNESIRLAEKSGYKRGLSIAYTDKGRIHNEQGNHPEALKVYQVALKYYHDLGDKKNEANLYNLIANTFHKQGDFSKALNYQYDALNIREEIGDEEGMAWSYNNIGTIYRIQGDYPAALKNFFVALETLQKFGDHKSIAIAYNSIGNVYSLQGKHTEALNNYFTSLRLRQKTGDKKEIIASYFNIGDAFCDLYQKDSLTNEVRIEYADNNFHTIPRANWLDSAMTFQNRAQVLNEELANKYYSIFSLSGMGRINYLKKNYRESIKLYTHAYSIATELNTVELQQEISKYLAENYDSLKDFKKGMNWYVIHSAHKDSLASKLKSDELLRTRMNYEFEKKENEARVIQEKKDALAGMELDRQKKMRNIFLGGFALVLLFAGIFFYQRNKIRKEKFRSDKLLLNILPSEIASELKQTGVSRTKSFNEVTVMFTDFVDFTIISEKISAESLVAEIHTCFSAFDNILQKYKIEKIKTIGDAYLCAGGLPIPDPGHAEQVIKAAIEIMDYMQQRKELKIMKNEIPFQLRIGIHSGTVVAGIVGVKKYAYDIWGDAVNIAARMEQNSLPGKINISSKTYDLIKDKYKCTYRGKILAKNKGEIDMYFLDG